MLPCKLTMDANSIGNLLLFWRLFNGSKKPAHTKCSKSIAFLFSKAKKGQLVNVWLAVVTVIENSRAQVNGILIPVQFCRISSDSGSGSTLFVLRCQSFKWEKGMWHYCYSNPQVSAGDGQNALFVWNRGFDQHSPPMWHPKLWARRLSCSHVYVFGGLFSIFCSVFLSFSTVPKITKPKNLFNQIF